MKIVFVHDHDWRKILIIYVCKVLDNSQAGSGPVETPQNLYIGAVDHGGLGHPAQYWHGYIDEVKIYSCVLTADEILAEYNAGL